MKYVPLREFENVTSALNFDTADCHVIGGCDLYTVKAAGKDKKLYKAIEHSLESQHDSLVRLSESLSPPNAELFSLNLSRPSPFGPLSESSSRRTFAYLIATLNASHPDYDFSNILRASDFRKERSLRTVMNTIDDTVYNLRPRPAAALLATPAGWRKAATAGPQASGASQTWGPKMWRAIDNEMTLRECEIYCYSPDEDPFDGEENALWSVNYLFFNKLRKRVCYIYLRGLSISSHSPIRAPAFVGGKRGRAVSGAQGYRFESFGPGKRARHWLSDSLGNSMSGSWDEDDDVDQFSLTHPGDDEVDVDITPDASVNSSCGFSDTDEDIEIDQRLLESAVRRMSEHIADSVEV